MAETFAWDVEPAPTPTPPTPPTGPDPLPGAVDHDEAARGTLITQFRHKPLIEGIVAAHAAGAQGVENALQQILACDELATAEGAQLTEIGELVGQARGTLTDDELRVFIAARVLVNQSSGTGDELLAIFDLVLSVQGGNGFELHEEFPAAVVVRVLGQFVPSAGVAATAAILRAARAGGVRSILEWSALPTDETFRFAPAGELAGASSLLIGCDAGALELQVDIADIGDWPAAGSLVLDRGGDAEVVTYDSLDVETGAVGLTAGTVGAHLLGASVEPAPGTGFDVGGLAAARE